MFDSLKAKLHEFSMGPDHWYYHGWGLTICWVVLAFFGLLIRKTMRGTYSRYIHIFFFILVDYASVFLELTSLYRVWLRLVSGV